MTDCILSATNLTRSFGGLVAVNDVSFRVERHEVFGIVGPNGAGKSTLFDLIAGVRRPSSGQIQAFGRRIEKLAVHERCWLGIGRTFQTSQMFPEHSVVESLMSVRAAAHRGVGGWLRPVGDPADDPKVAEMLEFTDLAGLEDALPAELTNLQQQKLAIGLALATGPQLLLLDEPSGGLIEAEVAELMRFIADIRGQGVTIVLIDHKMRLMMELSDRIMVMAAGRVIALGTPREVAADKHVQEAYLGHPAEPR